MIFTYGLNCKDLHLTNFDNRIGLKNIGNTYLNKKDNNAYENLFVFDKSIENLIDIENKIIIENYEPQTKARVEDKNRVLNETKYNLSDHYLDLDFLLSCINILSPIKQIAYSAKIKKRW